MNARDVAGAEMLTRRINKKVSQLSTVPAEPAQPARPKFYDKASVLAAYEKYGDLKVVCLETGAPPYVAFKWVKFSGLMKRKDSMKYGGQSSKVGALAEAEFKRLVPFAMDANKELESNCAGFDFDINGTTVDVKFCSLSSTGTYVFTTAAHKPIKPDFFVAFCAQNGGKDLSRGYDVLAIPNELLGDTKRAYIRRGGQYWDFKIPAEELAAFFKDYLEECV